MLFAVGGWSFSQRASRSASEVHHGKFVNVTTAMTFSAQVKRNESQAEATMVMNKGKGNANHARTSGMRRMYACSTLPHIRYVIYTTAAPCSVHVPFGYTT